MFEVSHGGSRIELATDERGVFSRGSIAFTGGRSES